MFGSKVWVFGFVQNSESTSPPRAKAEFWPRGVAEGQANRSRDRDCKLARGLHSRVPILVARGMRLAHSWYAKIALDFSRRIGDCGGVQGEAHIAARVHRLGRWGQALSCILRRAATKPVRWAVWNLEGLPISGAECDCANNGQSRPRWSWQWAISFRT